MKIGREGTGNGGDWEKEFGREGEMER